MAETIEYSQLVLVLTDKDIDDLIKDLQYLNTPPSHMTTKLLSRLQALKYIRSMESS